MRTFRCISATVVRSLGFFKHGLRWADLHSLTIAGLDNVAAARKHNPIARIMGVVQNSIFMALGFWIRIPDADLDTKLGTAEHRHRRNT